MSKFGKLFAFSLVLLVGVLLGFSQPTEASEVKSFKAPVGSIFVEIPYDKNKVELEKINSTDPNVDQVNVYDKETNELITEIKVEEEPLVQTNGFSTNATTNSYTQMTVTQSTGTSYGKAFLKARLNVYSSGSFRQINEVNTTWWEASSGMAYLEQQNSSAISTTGKYPTTKINVSGAATLTAEISNDYTVGFEAAGFSISGGASGTYYARKNVSHSYTYSLY
ncbi:hypothetical protein [Ureibacillus sinduriensis]|uniref:hypothetical protein n=1 Tax=Ureibacillus sinduriensis TaxID=561440 RepID=UPI0006892E13|nr:hypothetical protein [Ureibacillus sinduriensis]